MSLQEIATAHITELRDNIREDDRLEVVASSDIPFEEMIEWHVGKSLECYSVIEKGKLLGS